MQERNITVVDPEIDLTKVGPLGCGFVTGSGTVFNGLDPEEGSTIAIVGTGAVGAGALMAAKIKGCSKIICVDIHDNRLATALEIGATDTINSLNEDWVAKVKELTNGEGVDYAVDTTGGRSGDAAGGGRTSQRRSFSTDRRHPKDLRRGHLGSAQRLK